MGLIGGLPVHFSHLLMGDPGCVGIERSTFRNGLANFRRGHCNGVERCRDVNLNPFPAKDNGVIFLLNAIPVVPFGTISPAIRTNHDSERVFRVKGAEGIQYVYRVGDVMGFLHIADVKAIPIPDQVPDQPNSVLEWGQNLSEGVVAPARGEPHLIDRVVVQHKQGC